MKLKTAKRFLARNKWKIAATDFRLVKNSFTRRVRKSLRVLKKVKWGYR